ncbi:hypothetical protein BMS3Abin05_00412 [bacterium BMS3Abin05]|nr:hypothetical protein BMS3Abin05_00412 [bacterium BMS3Abin05]GBE26951.1 hypothetical protein BMS3Bbin03_00871 [bacterium BMS3Bbin03]
MFKKVMVVALLVALPTLTLSVGCSKKKEAGKATQKIEQKTAPAGTTAVETTKVETTAHDTSGAK